MPARGGVQNVPGRLRVADVDMDGYPDFVMTLSFKDTSKTPVKYFTESVILLNDASSDGKRQFSQVRTDSDSYFAKVLELAGQTANYFAFMDIDDDGKLDFILQKDVDDEPTVSVLYNNVVSENFFIKALSVNSELRKS